MLKQRFQMISMKAWFGFPLEPFIPIIRHRQIGRVPKNTLSKYLPRQERRLSGFSTVASLGDC
nr:hypothetical protein [Rhizobium sp. ACO-34A]